jgi:hypothetical protein
MKNIKRPGSLKGLFLSALGIIAMALPGSLFGATCLVKDGKPQAEIVIADQPLRMVKLAALELQAYIEKISGARLPITNEASKEVPVKIYVGKSKFTDRLKITDEGLKNGAFKMVAGDNYLALIGLDSEFKLPKIYMKGHADLKRALEEWDKVTGHNWEFPYSQIHKEYSAPTGLWEKDERGSLNAVYSFLYDQGVRWYAPGEFGEIVPNKSTIELPAASKTVTPDFPVRYPYQYGKKFGGGERDETLWQLRMGFDQAPDVIGVGYLAHGTAMVIDREEAKQAHPEYYALIGGKRKNGKDFVPCLTSKGLFEENVKMVRMIFDYFDAPMVSVMPTDGFTATCQCEGCVNKPTPERGWLGQYSDYVWEYVDRVAREVYKTHPDRKIVAMSYGSYFMPPTNIATFSPNIVVCMAQGRGRSMEEVRKARKEYLEKLPKGSRQFLVYEYYLHARAGNPHPFLPAFYPHAAAEDLKELKPFSLGDYVEVYRTKGLDGFAAAHLNLYITGKFWWNADQDVNAMLEEYYTLFYGPARDEMKAFIEYCEANWADMTKSADKINKAFELIDKARQKAPADSTYAKRVAWVADSIEPMKKLKEELAQGRGKVPQAQAVERSLKDLKLDGKFDDKFWEGANVYELKDLVTGLDPTNKASFKVAWADDNLCFAITCKDSDMKNLFITATKNEDSSIFDGDCAEVNIETPTHSYYQIGISPSGAVMDLDRKGRFNTQWTSNAKVAADKSDDEWRIEMSIPIADEMQGNIDQLHGVSGAKPSEKAPWYFNVCRQRIRGEKEMERSAFSPPMGEGGFHVVRKYGELTVK